MSPAASTRWCPTPEQVMILEEMYRGGVRTPNAAHIQQITAHLSIYGKIEGKNVFYWFQNHKARDRQKLRKRLVGRQQHHQHQHQHQHMMTLSPIPTSVSVVDQHHHFQQHPAAIAVAAAAAAAPASAFLHHHQPPLDHHHHHHHFDQLPCFPASSTLVGFHHHPPPLFLSSPCFPAALQPRFENRIGQVANTNSWKGENNKESEFGLEKEKTCTAAVRMSNNDYDWMMMMREEENDDDDDDDDYDHHCNNYDNDNGDDDEHSNSSRRSLKTLQLFPIKDKTSLKKDIHICGQPNNTTV